MSTKDDALIEKMLNAYHKSNLVQWEDLSLTSLQKASVRRDMHAALAVARKAILEEVLLKILKASEDKPNDVAYGMHEAGRVVASLVTQEQHNE